MPRLTIGITLESLGQPLRVAVVTAAQAGIGGLVFDAVGPLSPDTLGDTARREVRHLLHSHLIRPIALRCPLRHGLDEIKGLEARLERLHQAMHLSFDLGARLILLGIGAIPNSEDDPNRQRLKTVLNELSQYGDRIGSRIALDVGLEPIETMLALLQGIDSGSLGLSIDPATLLIEKLRIDSTLLAARSRLIHTFARDAIPRRIDRPAKEVALGAGDVDWLAWFGTLEAIGYTGAVTIRQAASTQPLKDATAAVQFLRRIGV
ncbi:MAG TPA: sugar phosphate isomerase/epimerase family protein [Gemmatales bacterium]|nr:sugar phosphate isomerase/epimerase family protein [Gemmatales bacterium]